MPRLMGARCERQPSRLEMKKLFLTGVAALFLAFNPVSQYCAQAARGWVALAEQVERIDIEIDIGGI